MVRGMTPYKADFHRLTSYFIIAPFGPRRNILCVKKARQVAGNKLPATAIPAQFSPHTPA